MRRLELIARSSLANPDSRGDPAPSAPAPPSAATGDRIQQLAASLTERMVKDGFLVLAGGEIEAAGVAKLLGVSTKMLSRWRAEKMGPAWRTLRRVAWYRAEDLARCLLRAP